MSLCHRNGALFIGIVALMRLGKTESFEANGTLFVVVTKHIDVFEWLLISVAAVLVFSLGCEFGRMGTETSVKQPKTRCYGRFGHVHRLVKLDKSIGSTSF